jgi:hypothetical protein
MVHKKVRRSSVVKAPESSDDEVERRADIDTSIIPDGTGIGPAVMANRSSSHHSSLDDASTTIPSGAEKSTAFLVSNWLVAEGEG